MQKKEETGPARTPIKGEPRGCERGQCRGESGCGRAVLREVTPTEPTASDSTE